MKDFIDLNFVLFSYNLNINFYLGHPKTLDQFNYTDVDMSNIVFKCMGNQSIIGLTHNVSFRNGEDPEMNAQLERVQSID